MHLRNLTWVHKLEMKRLKGKTLELYNRVGVDVSYYYVHIAVDEVLASQEDYVISNEEDRNRISNTQCEDAQILTNFVVVLIEPLEEFWFLHICLYLHC